MPYSCLILDDEQLAVTLVEHYVARVPSLHLLASFTDSTKALDFLRANEVDLIFIDIQMPKLTGLEMLKGMTNRPLTIITTAYPDYALQGFELAVTDYLLKPFPFERFQEAALKAVGALQQHEQLEILKEAVPLPTNALQDYMVVKADHKLYKVFFNDILYIEGLKEYVSIYTAKQRIITLYALKKLAAELPANKFLRIHKSYIVSTEKVIALDRNLLQIGAKYLPIGKTYREEVLQKIFGV